MKKYILASVVSGALAFAVSAIPASASVTSGAIDALATTASGPSVTPGAGIQLAHGWHRNCRWRQGWGWHYHQGSYRYACAPYGGGGGGGGGGY